MSAMTARFSTRSEEIDRLDREASLLAAKMEELAALPEKLQREREEREQTLPPPDDLADRERQSKFENMATRGEVSNRRRAQTRSLLLLFLLIASAAALLSWLVSMIQA